MEIEYREYFIIEEIFIKLKDDGVLCDDDDEYSDEYYPLSEETYNAALNIFDKVDEEVWQYFEASGKNAVDHVTREFSSEIEKKQSVSLKDIEIRVVRSLQDLKSEAQQFLKNVEQIESFVDEIVHYLSLDLDLPFYRGKDFFRNMSRQKRVLHDMIMNEESVKRAVGFDYKPLFKEFADVKLVNIHMALQESIENNETFEWEIQTFNQIVAHVENDDK
ncbi:unknown [Spodoptera litura nucleopolyhedrovirus II]|uniref:hypothetical protein n=1 Tax=Spodoptera litura nucleopolyhedrovirus II TaxID=566270 RepID=UPI00018745E1|nr:hypothetical protein SlnV2_gp050 [Spodoptera litura nucleopolyhedrovirus II]ACI47419.1 unknown [Spodoptera litura nucleopolyhedrovirus II]